MGPYALDLWTTESEHIATLEKGILLDALAEKLGRQHSRNNGPNTIVTVVAEHSAQVVSIWRYGRKVESGT